MITPVITWPAPHPGQLQLEREARRFNVAACGRRFGKTLEAEKLVAKPAAMEGRPTAWFAPTYKYLLDPMEDLIRRLAPITLRWNAHERRLKLISGGQIDFWSLDSEDPGRSRAYARVIIDEAGMAPKLRIQWEQAIRPTLSDLRGDAWFLGTPKGRNYFWEIHQRGIGGEDGWASWRLPTSINPYIEEAEIEAARRSLPERVFLQEYEAAFLEDAGGVFRGVIAAACAIEQARAQPGHHYVFGVDWGRHEDFTVIAVIDETETALVAIDRFNQIDYELQLGRLQVMIDRFEPHTIVAESNAMGEPLIEQLQRDGLPVEGFVTTNASKASAIDGLALGIEKGELRLLQDPVLISELQAFELSRTQTGLRRYSAPDGLHDDTVIALALAWTRASPAATIQIPEGFIEAYRPSRQLLESPWGDPSKWDPPSAAVEEF